MSVDLAAVIERIVVADRERINASAAARGLAGSIEVVVSFDVSTRMQRVDVRVPGQGVRTFPLTNWNAEQGGTR